jgi:predicted ArsR family transcriptional regulator
VAPRDELREALRPARPGSGRPAKLYRRSKQEFDVSVPARDYELPAHILSDAVASSPQIRGVAIERAHDVGLELGAQARKQAGAPRARSRIHEALHKALEHQGFEPEDEGADGTRLRNCPFDTLAKEHTDLMCGMNHALVRGLLEGLQADDVEAVLDPAPGERCCVRLVPTHASDDRRQEHAAI